MKFAGPLAQGVLDLQLGSKDQESKRSALGSRRSVILGPHRPAKGNRSGHSGPIIFKTRGIVNEMVRDIGFFHFGLTFSKVFALCFYFCYASVLLLAADPCEYSFLLEE